MLQVLFDLPVQDNCPNLVLKNVSDILTDQRNAVICNEAVLSVYIESK